jgi:hypothetical protein
MLQVSFGVASATEPEQQQQTAVAPGTAVQSNGASRQDPGYASTPSKAQIISFESVSDTDVAVDLAADATAGAWFRLYDASFDDEPDAPAVEDLVAELVSLRLIRGLFLDLVLCSHTMCL